MVAIKSVAHFSIPVSDIERSTAFYTEIVGCRHLETVGRGTMAFLDAAGTCLILVKRAERRRSQGRKIVIRQIVRHRDALNNGRICRL